MEVEEAAEADEVLGEEEEEEEEDDSAVMKAPLQRLSVSFGSFLCFHSDMGRAI